MTAPYPLAWPAGVPRSHYPVPSQFKTGLSAALKNVKGALELFAKDSGKTVTDVVLSSNVGGLDSGAPKDTGVAIWFVWDGEQRCIAVDRYPKVEDNLQAIYHILEARRTEVRHGGLHVVRQTFKGFISLPGPPAWWDVLGVSRTASAATIDATFRSAAKTAHPDAGGDRDAWERLNTAYQAAKAARQ